MRLCEERMSGERGEEEETISSIQKYEAIRMSTRRTIGLACGVRHIETNLLGRPAQGQSRKVDFFLC